ncbi:MAG: hypothetical protein ABJD07_13760 [Gemmatimonadaceae bacterium]
MDFMNFFDTIARDAKRIAEQLGSATTASGGAALDTPGQNVPFAIDRRPWPQGDAIDQLLPSRVGAFVRTGVNDRFGGLRNGGVMGFYAKNGEHVMLTVILRADITSAQEEVRGSRPEELICDSIPAESLDVGQETGSHGTEPSWLRGDKYMSWTRHNYVFCLSANDNGSLDDFVGNFPY